jgi:hypothetical protein
MSDNDPKILPGHVGYSPDYKSDDERIAQKISFAHGNLACSTNHRAERSVVEAQAYKGEYEKARATLTARDAEVAQLRGEVERLRAERDEIGQGVEDLILVAKKTEDSGGYVTGYRFNTGALHRLLGVVRQRCPGIDTRNERVRPPCGVPAPFYAEDFTPCVAPYGHDGMHDHRPLAKSVRAERDAALAKLAAAERDLRNMTDAHDTASTKYIRALKDQAAAEAEGAKLRAALLAARPYVTDHASHESTRAGKVLATIDAALSASPGDGTKETK